MSQSVPTRTRSEVHEVLDNMPSPLGLSKMILLTCRDDRGTNIGVMMGRGDNGMIVGSAVRGAVHFGMGDCTVDYYFTTQDYALAYLKCLARKYLCRDDVDFLVEEASPIIMPSSTNGTDTRRM